MRQGRALVHYNSVLRMRPPDWGPNTRRYNSVAIGMIFARQPVVNEAE